MKHRKILRALLETGKMYDRSKVEDTFKKTATKNNLSPNEIDEGLLLVKKLCDEPLNENLIHYNFIKNTTEIVFETFKETLNSLDFEIPAEFSNCKTIEDVKEKMKKDFNLLTKEEEIDDFGKSVIKITFSKYIYSTSFLFDKKDYNLESFTKLAKLAITSSEAYSYYFLSLH